MQFATKKIDRDEVRRQVGRRLHLLRKSRKLNKDSAAARAGISASTVTNIEEARFDTTFLNVAALAAALDVSMQDLILPLANVTDHTLRTIWQ